MDRQRRVVNYSLIALATGGFYFGADAVFSSLNPPKKAMLDSATFINTNELPINNIAYFTWQKKPIFVFKKDDKMGHNLKRDIKIGEFYYTVMIGICTHLGCVPKYEEMTQSFICPCHNGAFNYEGIATKPPVTKPLVIPPFKVQGEMIVVGEVGEEYLNLMDRA